jgi:Ca2+-binding EF-hand superfamily protein
MHVKNRNKKTMLSTLSTNHLSLFTVKIIYTTEPNIRTERFWKIMTSSIDQIVTFSITFNHFLVVMHQRDGDIQTMPTESSPNAMIR